MALVLNDRVKETTTTTGTGTLNLAGAATNFETFVAGIGDGNTVYYAIVHQTAAEFEVGLGTVTDGSPDTLSRTTILSSSNSDSAVSFSSGTKDVFCTLPASKAVFEDASNVVSISTIDIVDGSTTNGTITSSSNSLTLNGRNSGTLIFQTGGSERARLNSDALTLTSAKIAHASDFTLDVGGDLFLDADGAGIFLSDGGTSVGRFLLSSSDLTIGALVQDKDIIFKGNDGGSSITALTLDMSNAGRATFNENVTVGGNLDVSGADVTITANIIHAGDTNTFFGFNDADTFRIVTGGTEALRVDSSQRVGIGTTSPSEKLSISPDTDVSAEIGKAHIGSVGHSDYAGFAHVDKNTTSDYALLQGASGDTFLNASDGQRIKFRINNSEKATIDSSGNLGIGTSSPSQTLHVNGNAFVSGQTFLGDASGDTVTLTGSLAHAGDFTIDVGGDITLDADGGDIKLSNGGTQFANFGDATGAVHIDAVISDDDIKFRGNDGGSTITALLLDMSASGAATFNAGGTFGGVLAVNSGTTNTVATFTSTDAGAGFNLTDDSGTSTIQTNGANLRIGVDEDAAVSSSAIQFRVDGSTKATINSSGYLLVGKTDTSFTTNGTEIRGGNLGARIIRQNAEPLTLHRQSSDGEVINLFVDSTQIGSLGTSSSDLVLTSSVSDKDILFKGNDGGSTITALTLDMSASGAATFNDQITLGGNLVHTGNFTIDSGGDITLDADGADIKLSDGGTEFGRFTKNGNDFELRSIVTNGDFKIIGERTAGTVNALSIDMSDGGAATFSSHIQTNFLKLENAQISQTSGDLTLDVAGDINLDADGADIKFSDGGSHFFSITKSSTHALLHNPISNGDIQIKGLDDGSAITAITIDMSEAGNTTFNANVTVGGDLTVQGTTTTLNTATLDVEDKNITLNFGSGDTSGSANGAGITIQDAVSASTDATILWDATNDEFDFSHTVNVTGSVVAQTKLAVGVSAVHGSYGLYNQNNAYFNGAVTIDDNLAITAGSISITGDGGNATTLTESGSGDFTIDTVGNIVLNADDGGIQFRDASAYIGSLGNSSGDFSIMSRTDDKDIVFKGIDGGSTITALTLDISDAGTATFNHDVKLGDNGRVKFGDAGDMSIFHNATDTFIQNATGSLIIENTLDDSDIVLKSDDGSGGTTAYITLDGSGTRVIFDQHTRHTDNFYAAFGSDSDLRLFHDGTDSKIQQSSGATGNLIIEQAIDDKDIILKSDNGSGGTAAYITLDGSTTLTQFDKDTKHVDSVKATFGDSSDLQIFHDGSDSFIKDEGTGNLRISSNGAGVEINKQTSEYMIRALTDGAVELYHNNNKKLETTSTGVTITDNLTLGSDSVASSINILGDVFTLDVDSNGNTGGTPSMRFNISGSEKARINSSGLDVSGTVTATALNISQGTPLITLTDTSSSATTTITLDGVNTTIDSNGTDGDIIFKGSDGGSEITALTLDMSNSGRAVFNAGAGFFDHVNFSDNAKAVFGGGDDLQIYHDGSNSYIIDNGTGKLLIRGSTGIDLQSTAGEDFINMTENGAVTLRHDNQGKLTTTSSGVQISDTISSTSDLTLDVAGDITLDADGADIRFKDSGSTFGLVSSNNADEFVIQAGTQDKDIIFKGNDGGSVITALTLDMSAGGKAVFANNIDFGDGHFIGNDSDDNLYIASSAGEDIRLDAAGNIILDADGGQIQLTDAGTNIGLLQMDSSQNLIFRGMVQDKDVQIKGNDGGSTITAVTFDMSEAGAATFNNNVTAFSDERLKDNIETLEDGLDKVEQLRGVTYTRDEKENIGVIAQEVERILPEIVLTADDEMGTKSVDYSRITAVLIEAVKELSARVKELESK